MRKIAVFAVAVALLALTATLTWPRPGSAQGAAGAEPVELRVMARVSGKFVASAGAEPPGFDVDLLRRFAAWHRVRTGKEARLEFSYGSTVGPVRRGGAEGGGRRRRRRHHRHRRARQAGRLLHRDAAGAQRADRPPGRARRGALARSAQGRPAAGRYRRQHQRRRGRSLAACARRSRRAPASPATRRCSTPSARAGAASTPRSSTCRSSWTELQAKGPGARRQRRPAGKPWPLCCARARHGRPSSTSSSTASPTRAILPAHPPLLRPGRRADGAAVAGG